MSHVAHPNESCHIYEWVMSHVWMIHGTHECTAQRSLLVPAHTNESCQTYEWVMSHIWMSHVTRMNESWYTWMHGTEIFTSSCTYECVTSRMNECRHTSEWVTSHMQGSWHIWMIYGTYEWVTFRMNALRHVWMRHVPCEWVMAQMNTQQRDLY